MKLLKKAIPISITFTLVSSLLAIPTLSIPQAAQAAFPGYNGKILIQSNRSGNNELYLVNSDGSNPINLTNNAASDSGGRWSSDGSKIAFNSDRDGNTEVYVMDADGSNVVRLTNDAAADTANDWSPDDTQLLVQSNRSGSTRLWIINADGSNPTCITCSMDGGGHYNASWSPNGDRIAFQVNGVGNGIFTIKVDGTDAVQLTTVEEGRGIDQTPYWSPDGQSIVYMSPSALSADTNELYLMNADGSNKIRLTNDNFYENSAKISPDGTMIGFTRADDIAGNSDSRDPWTMNIDGSNQTRLFQTGFTDWFQGWQPIPNTPPVLASKNLTLQSNTSSSIDVLTGATDEEALDPNNLTITTQPTHGTASIESGNIKYTPNADYIGNDELEYKICDSFILDQKCSTGVLAINVQAADKPKVAISKIGDIEYSSETNTYNTTNPRPTFSGTADPLAQIRIEIHSDPIILTTTADENGNWSVTPNQDIPLGKHTVYITATLNGETTELDEFILSIQEQLPNTGANNWPQRGGGLLLLGIGIGLTYWQKRRIQSLIETKVPSLFP